MSVRTTVSVSIEQDDDYAALERLVRNRATAVVGRPVFETDGEGYRLWDAYLEGIPEHRRGHYTCRSCQHFIERFGGLVTVTADGDVSPVLWDGPSAEIPPFFYQSVCRMRDLARSPRVLVTGVFLSSESAWGTAVSGGWVHLSAANPNVFSHPVLAASQAAAEKKADYAILSRSLADYPVAAATQAVRVLRSGSVARAEKALGVAEWFAALHDRLEGVPRLRRYNLIWAAVATAPPGYCHVRSTVISTLLDDVVAGVPFDALARRWAEKLDPLQYQRPTAAPAAGAIDAAERLVEKLGVARSLERRFARLEEVQTTLWTPPPATPTPAGRGGVFGHLRSSSASGVAPVRLPPTAITWERFARVVLPTATGLEVPVPATGNFYGLVTATHADAPPVLQWDGLAGCPRNPTSVYVYAAGSPARQWGLTAGGYAAVTAVFPPPWKWQTPTEFDHLGESVYLALAGCRDANYESGGLALFPETLKAEFHGIRSVVEAHSRRGRLSGAEAADANGLVYSKRAGAHLTLRVRSTAGEAIYTVDRWE